MKRMKNLQGTSGITLVALVVTIIVLLILAGITITLLFSENGVIKKAQKAKEATEISQIKEEAELVKLNLMMNNLGSTITKSSLVTALNEHFVGSTLENGRVVVKDGNYDIIVRDNLEIVVVKHGEEDTGDTSADSEIRITYETVGYYYNKTIKVYLEVGTTYEEYAREILAGATETEKEQMFVEADKYYRGDQIAEEAKNITDFTEWMNYLATQGAFAEGTEIPTTLEKLKEYGNANFGWTYETVDDMLIGMKYVEPEQYYILYPLEDITVTCSNGETKTTNTNKLYVEFEVTEEGTYTVVATTESGKRGEVQVDIDITTTAANYEVEDSYGNKITVPGGFSIVANGTDGVEYTYTGDGTPAVQDGVVIEDNYGNQFVWIPVGTIKNKADDPNGPTTTITLARYAFNTDGTIASTVTDGDTAIGNCKELATSTYGNTTAKDIEEFKTKATTKGGYYIARYEASNNNGKVASKSGVAVWNGITQPNAATKARAMYGENSYFVSDLVNSYAWDTAIVFIQTYSGDNDYSRQSSLNTTLGNTGERNDGTTDKICNIYDMASNIAEFTTETYMNANLPCTHRGSVYNGVGFYTAVRSSNAVDSNDFSSRLLLYVK